MRHEGFCLKEFFCKGHSKVLREESEREARYICCSGYGLWSFDA